MICKELEDCTENTLAGKKNQNCVNRDVNCISSCDCRSSIKCEENSMVYILQNTTKSLVALYHMDGGIIKNDRFVPQGTAKCDYMIVTHKHKMGKRIVLVELKGKDVKHALEQIDGTLTMYQSFFSKCSNVYARAVVVSAQPKLNANPRFVKLYSKLKESYNGNLKIRERKFIEKDIELINA